MKLRARLMLLSVSTVALIVTVLFALHVDSLTRTWLATAVDRSNEAAKQIQSLILLRIAANPDHSRRNWNRIVANDPEIAAMLVEQANAPSGSIVEINIVADDGRILISSIPSRRNQDAFPREGLVSVRDSGLPGRLSAILTSKTDYETRLQLVVAGQSRPVFEIQLLVSPVLLRDKIRPDLESAAWVSLLALFAAVGLAAFSAHLALIPVRRIGKAIDTLATGNPLGLTFPAKSREDREVAAVEYKLSLLGEKMQGERRNAIGALVRTVAHEIKNPLNAITLRLESLRMRIADEIPEAEPEIDLVSHEVQRLDRVVRTFLDLNQPLELDIEEFDPTELAASVLETMRPAATQSRVDLQLQLPAAPFTIRADRGLIEQGLVNIVNNAIQAMAAGGLVKTSVSLARGNCEIAVTDNGPGMPSSVRDRIFDPYFTTKATGSGIGLAITKRAMDLHRGTIAVETAPGAGTRMILSFPALFLLILVGCAHKQPVVIVPSAPAPVAAVPVVAPPAPAQAVPSPPVPATESGKPSPFPPARPAPVPAPALGAMLTPDQRRQLDTAYQSDLRQANDILSRIKGRTLTAAQNDTVSRAQAFIRQASQYHDRDLTTAAELARRARLLTQDLAAALK